MYNYYEEPYYNPEDFLEQYEKEIRDILLKGINSKIKDSIENLQLEKERNQKLEEELRELRTNLYTTNQIHKDQLDKALKEKSKEVERKLGLGFAVNDTVYYIKSESKTTKCTKCDGKGKVSVEVLGKLTQVPCPHCSSGNVYQYTYKPISDTIASLKFWISRTDRNNKNSEAILKENWDIDIYLDKYDCTMSRKNLYKTLEECQKECDIRSKEDKKSK